jgi:hypothetical protein
MCGVRIRARIQVHHEEGDMPDKWGSPVGNRTREGRRGWAGEGGALGRRGPRGKKENRPGEGKRKKKKLGQVAGLGSKERGRKKGFYIFQKDSNKSNSKSNLNSNSRKSNSN